MDSNFLSLHCNIICCRLLEDTYSGTVADGSTQARLVPQACMPVMVLWKTSMLVAEFIVMLYYCPAKSALTICTTFASDWISKDDRHTEWSTHVAIDK